VPSGEYNFSDDDDCVCQVRGSADQISIRPGNDDLRSGCPKMLTVCGNELIQPIVIGEIFWDLSDSKFYPVRQRFRRRVLLNRPFDDSIPGN
jgi:hypothetical protein